MQSYKYTSLSTDAHHAIRLLRIHEALVDDLISCELRTATTDAKYLCLSYTWGSEDNQQDILMNGYRLRVRRNLWEFLQTARQNYADAELWIDAVCINQADDVERARQVQMMMDIYLSGQLTIVWLGNPPLPSSGLHTQVVDSNTVLVDVSSWFESFIDLLVDLELPKSGCLEQPKVIVRQDGLWALDVENSQLEVLLLHLLEGLARDDTLGSVWFLVQTLCYHVYWTRMWIVQEIYSSQCIDLVYGNAKVGAREFFHILSFLRQLGEAISYDPTIKPRKEFKYPQIRPKDSYYVTLLGIPPYTITEHQPDATSGKKTAAAAGSAIPAALQPILIDLWLHNTASNSDGCIADRLGAEWLSPRPTEQLDLAVLLDAYQTSQCSSRNDKVFALAGLCSNTLPVKVDYSLSLCDLYFRVCESPDVIEEQRTFLMSCLMRNLRISLLDFLMNDGRTMTKRLVHGSDVKAGVELSRTEMPYYARSRVSNTSAEDFDESFFMRGYCEHCSGVVDFEYMGPSPDGQLELDVVFVQCFGRAHIGISLDFHPELGYKVLFIEQVDHMDRQYDLPIPKHQLWKSDSSVDKITLSLILKEAIVLHKLLLEEVTFKDDDIAAPAVSNSGKLVIDDLVIRFSGCQAFARSKKVSHETLSKLFEPELVILVTQYLNDESKSTGRDSERPAVPT